MPGFNFIFKAGLERKHTGNKPEPGRAASAHPKDLFRSGWAISAVTLLQVKARQRAGYGCRSAGTCYHLLGPKRLQPG